MFFVLVAPANKFIDLLLSMTHYKQEAVKKIHHELTRSGLISTDETTLYWALNSQHQHLKPFVVMKISNTAIKTPYHVRKSQGFRFGEGVNFLVAREMIDPLIKLDPNLGRKYKHLSAYLIGVVRNPDNVIQLMEAKPVDLSFPA